jgi:hypothetical protein
MDLTIVNLRKELPGYYRRLGYVENGMLPFPEDQHPPKMPCHLVRMSKLSLSKLTLINVARAPRSDQSVHP